MKLRSFLTLAAIVGPYPNTITPGTLADANQVQGNFDWVRNQVNANVTGGGGAQAGVNLLTNGAMQVSQRFVATSKNVAAASQAYTLDRWQVKAGVGSSADVQQQRTIANPGFVNSIRVQRTAANAAVTTIQLAQSLESIDCGPLQGQIATISFQARCGGNYSPTSALLNCSVFTGTGTDENVLSGYTGGATVITKDNALSTSWQAFQATASVALGAAITEAGVVFTMTPTGTAGAADWFEVTGVQIEVAPAASAFQIVPFATQIARCQRYYQKNFPYGTVPAQSVAGNIYQYLATIASTTTQFSPTIILPTRMRTTPTATIYNPQAANAQVRNLTRSADLTATATPFLSDALMVVSATGTAATAVADQLILNYTLEAEL